MSQSYDLNALFHPNVDIGEQASKNATEYSPSADKGSNGVYKSVIRFIPWWQDPQHSIFEKWVSWLVDPVTNRGRFIDCPTSVGKPSVLQEMFFKLRKSESVLEQKKSETFSRRHSFAAIIQVIKDPHNKELEGKLLVFKFGKKIFEKIEAEKKPILGDPHEPFDLIDGKAFELTITKVSGFNNYDQSKFSSKKIPLLLPIGENGKIVELGPNAQLRPINEKTPKDVVFNYLKENSPDLGKYAFKEWDQETHDYVNQVILSVTGQTPSSTYADVRNSSNKPSGAKPESSKSTITSKDLTLEDLDVDSNISNTSDLNFPELNNNSGINIEDDLEDMLGNI